MIRANHIIEVNLKRPKMANFEPGHPFCVLVDERFPSALNKLREKGLASDTGPYADNEKQDVQKIAWLMRKFGKGDLEEEAKWLIDIIVPRIQHFVVPAGKDEEGNEKYEEKTDYVNIPDIHTHPDFEILFNGIPGSARESDEAMVPGRFLSQELLKMRGSNYILGLYTEELGALATSVMRVSGRKAFMTQIKALTQDGDEAILSEGVAVFPDERTMVHFPIDRTHPDISGLSVLSDQYTLSLLYMRAAQNKLRKEFNLIKHEVLDGLTDEKVINERMKSVKEIVGKAKALMPENPEIPLFLKAAAERRYALRNQMYFQIVEAFVDGVRKYLTDMVDWISENKGIAKEISVEMPVVTEKGIKKSKVVRHTSGVKPEEVEDKIKFATNSLVAGFKKYGPWPSLMQAKASLSHTIEVMLPHFGLSDESVRNLRAYVFEQGKLFDEPYIAEVNMDEQDVREGLCGQGVLSKMVKLHKEIVDSKGKMPVEEVRVRAKEMIDSLVEGLKQFGRDSEPLEGIRKGMGNFVTVKLPENGYSPELVKELKIYYFLKQKEVSK